MWGPLVSAFDLQVSVFKDKYRHVLIVYPDNKIMLLFYQFPQSI